MLAPFWLVEAVFDRAVDQPFPSPIARSSGLVAGTRLYPLLLQLQQAHADLHSGFKRGEMKTTFKSVTTQTTSFHSLNPQKFNLKMLHKTLAMGLTTAAISPVTRSVNSKTRFPGSGRKKKFPDFRVGGKGTHFVVLSNMPQVQPSGASLK